MATPDLAFVDRTLCGDWFRDCVEGAIGGRYQGEAGARAAGAGMVLGRNGGDTRYRARACRTYHCGVMRNLMLRKLKPRNLDPGEQPSGRALTVLDDG